MDYELQDDEFPVNQEQLREMLTKARVQAAENIAEYLDSLADMLPVLNERHAGTEKHKAANLVQTVADITKSYAEAVRGSNW